MNTQSELFASELQGLLKTHKTIKWPASEGDENVKFYTTELGKIFTWIRESNAFERNALGALKNSGVAGAAELVELIKKQNRVVAFHRKIPKEDSAYYVYFLARFGWSYIGFRVKSIET